jgi:phosphatidate cytidylyltransferase
MKLKTNIKKRFWTSCIIILILALYFVFGSLYTAKHQEWSGYIFLILTSLLLAAFLYELTNLYNIRKWKIFFYIYALCMGMLMLWFPARQGMLFVPYVGKIGWFQPWMMAIVIFFIFINCMLIPLIFKQISFLKAFILFVALVYLTFACKSLNYFMLTVNYGWETCLFIFIIVIASDTFAYLGGSLLGKHKLAPTISPNKTIEGSIIGFVTAVGLGLILTLILQKSNQQVPFRPVMRNINESLVYVFVFIISIILSLVSQIGDLLFSAIKRKLNIKDFSNLLPGHGGFLDRFDALTLVLIVSLVIAAI